MSDLLTWVQMMHSLYQELTGLRVTLDPSREWAWYEWHRRGIGPDDLRALVAWRKSRIRTGDLPPTSLAFRNLVGHADYAEEDIAILRSRESARRAAGSRITREPDPRDHTDPDARRRWAEALRKLRTEL